jgi:hypothetical protein
MSVSGMGQVGALGVVGLGALGIAKGQTVESQIKNRKRRLTPGQASNPPVSG